MTDQTKELATDDGYRAVCMQVKCQAVSQINDRSDARALVQSSIARIHSQLIATKNFIGEDLKLAVFPEYFLTGFPMLENLEAWIEKACWAMNGAEYDALGKVAQATQLHLSGNAYELDPHFPGLYFQTSFIIAPSGDVILRYRRLNSLYTPTPHDVWDRYLEVYGLDAVFPVVDTPLGKLACIASEEILYPEIARCHLMRGAEVFLHSSSQANETARAVKEVCTVARAIENCAYVVSTNTGGYEGTAVPMASTDGGSKIVDYQGLVLAKTGWGETMTATAELDLRALRRFRQRVGMDNLVARQRFELYADSYAQHHHYPVNNLDGIQPTRSHFHHTLRATIERLKEHTPQSQ